ncbi:hypothetical protein [Methylococcus mesophilus]|uniref:hypothetical protein n=1 Tax=Methylococcus mesophilus TaxID=2993564 RepID=UPI00224AD5D6|nr:hypothetical protein [Methylococcus mesophilus]UZR29075.1 hypothetical protein OOT43_00180 [Methylococcus mesophilus]
MPLELTYTDAALKGRITPELEVRARADIDAMGPFLPESRDKLTVLRVYILACLEHGGQRDDAFEVKLGQYRKEFEFIYRNAKRPDGSRVTFMSVPIERA